MELLPEMVKSPKRLDKIIRGYTGTLGSIGLDSMDQALGKKDGVPVVGGLVRNFVINAENTPQSVNDFYKYKEILDSKVSAANRKGEEPNPVDAQTRVSFFKAADVISKLQDVQALIDRSDDPDKELKSAAIQAEIIDIARGMNKIYENLYR